MKLLSVMLGGALGAAGRYGLSLLPLPGAFPAKTLITNLLGALLIGFIAGAAGRLPRLSPELILFGKAGFCGAFTTFSTFSLETVELIRAHRTLLACVYTAASVVLCLLGTAAGLALARRLGSP